MSLSVVLATYNEEKNITSCLKSVKGFADELIVVDGSSTDQTREIARRLGAKVIKTENLPMFHTNKQMAIEAASGDWILQLDADEIVSKELERKIRKIIKTESPASAFAIPRKNYFLGRWLRKGGQYPDNVIRLFKRGKARFPQKSVHEQLEVDGEVKKLTGHLIHHTAPTLARYVNSANRYTSLTAQELKQQRIKLSPQQTFKFVVFKPCRTFFLNYVRHKGFMDGFPGFVFALFSGLHWPIAYMKYWEQERMRKK
ncbi:MAG: hypothetical protein A3A65_04405 [Candidatus Chisholmbacteria bacterium RIFCSPLOWO2_01_FULL_49_14]|uniref:Glycosyltransferase 2-like domain-containing protein n=1 Tax=Candidatus Chisholmbacteria bacterium RIFCSPLOWO2_01_FULL_49_14 TaxID=1797593 RepID=A0A1G1W3W4_9BACT|nr:MAG: hypothetical protein A3A65_04405 [Candidatus Chisholmbacteria bacterium RIFCSPLOWO2_01_FULL_49_14]